ncbi:MAG: anthranilate synthase component I family protein [Chlamydiales bacterium]
MESISLPVRNFSRDNFLTLCNKFATVPYTSILYSGGDYETSVQSYLAIYSIENIVITQKDINPWDTLQRSIGQFQKNNEKIPLWLGFISYPMGETSDMGKIIPMKKTSFPLAQFHRYNYVFIYEHCDRSLCLYWQYGENNNWLSIFKSSEFWKDIQSSSKLQSTDAFSMTKYRMGESRIHYHRNLYNIFDLIRSGVVYQLNYSHKFVLHGNKPPFSVFITLTKNNPAPFSSYYYSPEFSIVSSSPELFLKKEGNLLETRPIKGTAKRGKTTSADQKNYNYLIHSEKECAELAMITDLMRNDFGKISEIGSVKVVNPSLIEAYTNVFQKFSIVQSYARKNLHPIDIIRACFPGGSITGCPKLKAVEIINKLEMDSRDIYTGSIGMFFANGDFIFNIAIRTITFQDDILTFRLGGGIVLDSIPEREYLETLAKGESILQALLGI